MTAAPLWLRSPGLSSDTHTSSSAHARQARSSAFHREFAARVAESGDQAEAPAKASAFAEPASDKPAPESLLRSSLMAQNTRPVELAKTSAQHEHTSKPLPGVAQEEGTKQTVALKTATPGNGKTRSEAGAEATDSKSKTTKPASHAEDDPAPQSASAEIPQSALISTESAQAAAQVSSDACRAGAAEKSIDKISGDAADAVGEAGEASTDPQPGAVTGDLSLALKISGESGKSTDDSKALASGLGSEAAASLHGQTHEAPDHGDTSSNKDTASLAAAEMAESGSFKTENTAQTEAATTSDAAATQLEHASQLEKLRNESVHGVHVQVESETNGKLDVRMVERAGQLSVTVRSADPAVTRALQDHSSELTTRLALEQYHTELWKPTAPESSNGKPPFQQAPEQNGGTGGRNETNGDRKRKDQNPKWVDEMEQTPLSRKVKTTI